MSEDKIRLAGKIAGTALAHGAKLIKVDVPYIEVAEEVEKKIFSMGGKLAFPVCISKNHIAAHATPIPNDTTIFGKEDIIKLDVGVHVDGWVADNARTIDIGGKYTPLVKASKDALDAAIKTIKPGVHVQEIGRAIQETISDAGYAPVRNLSGHLIEHWNVHAGISIPNYDNGDPTILKEGMQIAIEPFATNGEGIVIEGKGGGIFHIEHKKPVRDPYAKKILEHLEKEHKTLYFSRRAVNLPMRDYAFNILERDGILHQHPELVERSKGQVAQFEHAMLITKNGVDVVTRVD